MATLHREAKRHSGIVTVWVTAAVGALLLSGCATKQPSSITFTNEGIVLQQQGDLDGAIAKYRQALAIDPNDAQAHLALGSALQKKKDIDGAIAEYRAALSKDPNLAGAHLGLGYCLHAKKDNAGAIRELKAYLQNPPPDEPEMKAKVEQDVQKLEAAH
ncbi:MAG: tetratricopeptide repeat protein [Candidatus Binatia bacterium]